MLNGGRRDGARRRRLARRALDLARPVYNRLPLALRRSAAVTRLKAQVYEALLSHDEIYTNLYYESVEESAARSADIIADSVIQTLEPKTIIDVGCGTGALLGVFVARGCTGRGLELSDAGLERCRARGLDVRKFNLETDFYAEDTRFDVAVSMEVAEHLPGHAADRYIDLLTSLADQVVFTAAPPGAGGLDHINEQPPAYWIRRFRDRGLSLDVALTEDWKNTWRRTGVVEPCYYDNLMVFRRPKGPRRSR